MRELLEYAVPYMKIRDNLREIVREYVYSVDEKIHEKYYGSLVPSSDDGIHCSQSLKVEVSLPHGPMQFENGKILYIGTAVIQKAADKEIYIIFSDDGKTWSSKKDICSVEEGGKLCEPFATEAEENHIILMHRFEPDEHNVEGECLAPIEIYQCDSYDGGNTFTKPHKTGIMGGPPHMIKYHDGRIIITYGRREKPNGVSAVVSDDNGKTLGKEVILDDKIETFDFGYPCSVEMMDRKILAVYYYNQNKGENANIRYVVWDI